MKQHIDDMPSFDLLSAQVIIQDERIQQEGPVIDIIGFIKYPAVERSNQVGKVFIIGTRFLDEDGVIQLCIAKAKGPDINNQYNDGKPQ